MIAFLRKLANAALTIVSVMYCVSSTILSYVNDYA